MPENDTSTAMAASGSDAGLGHAPEKEAKEALCATLREGLEAGLKTAHECKLNATYHIRVIRQAICALSLFEQQFPEVNPP